MGERSVEICVRVFFCGFVICKIGLMYFLVKRVKVKCRVVLCFESIVMFDLMLFIGFYLVWVFLRVVDFGVMCEMLMLVLVCIFYWWLSWVCMFIVGEVVYIVVLLL